MAQQLSIPIQPVENPILCSPYKEPDQHWLYDTRTGIPTKTPGRRPASYWFKSERRQRPAADVVSGGRGTR
jgi:type III restriction enzyme